MKYGLTEDQVMIRDLARKFAQSEVEPVAEAIDRDAIFPEKQLKSLAELGFTGMTVPEAYGGAGMDYVSYVLAIEELSKASTSVANVLGTHSMAGEAIMMYGTEEQKKVFLPRLASCQDIGGFALTEPDAGSDAAAVSTKAVLDGDDYVINGNKMFISNGDHATILILIARTGPEKGVKGLTAFIVDKHQSPFVAEKHEDKMGLRGSHTNGLVFSDCRVPAKNMLGKIGEGFKVAMNLLNGGRVCVSAQFLGLAEACLEESVTYAKVRTQFGKPIARFQAIQWMIADMQKDIIAAKAMVYSTAKMLDDHENVILEAACTKLFVTEMAMKHAIKAVQIQGGYGYVKESKVERLMRDAKIGEIFEGTSEVQRIVISGQVLR